MSYADKLFVQNANNIIKSGTDTRGQLVRPKWPDGTPAYTIKQFGVVNKYDLRKEFPAITLRPVALKSCMDEILWIYQRKSNNIHDLKPHIWDQWADDTGSIGKAYGYQVGKKYLHHVHKMTTGCLMDTSEIEEFKKLYPSIEFEYSDGNYNVYMDQMDAVIYDLRNAPYGRRIMISLWNPDELYEMRLQPCCWSITFNVTNEGDDKLILNMHLNQRSNDFLAANAWNVCQYAILLMMVAQVTNMKPGVLMHCITDEHIYDRYVDLVKQLITRDQFPAPKVSLNPEITDFYKFTTDDLIVENYQHGIQIPKIPIAE